MTGLDDEDKELYVQTTIQPLQDQKKANLHSLQLIYTCLHEKEEQQRQAELIIRDTANPLFLQHLQEKNQHLKMMKNQIQDFLLSLVQS